MYYDICMDFLLKNCLHSGSHATYSHMIYVLMGPLTGGGGIPMSREENGHVKGK